jgi:hypothetical protein
MYHSARNRTIAIAIGGLVALTLSAAFADDLIPQDSVIEAPTAPLVESPAPTLAPQETTTVLAESESVTVAQEIGNSPISTPRPTPTPTISAPPSPTPRPTAPTDLDLLAENETPTVEILISPQPRLTLHMPISLGIDPRSRSYLMNSIEFWGTSTYLACFTGYGVGFDVGTSGAIDDFQNDNFIVEGDRTPNLKISGTGAAIKSLLRTPGGIRINSASGALAGHSLSLSLTALTSAATDQSYCGASKAMSTSVFLPLKIDLGLVKGQGTLKK